mmetsp:Transcript_4165/g.16834  ORF Transcript_4165/g.16834 Transcript_4165/m.16834 type:complete len:201 (-) Transcript_4165:820-1422(-)
MARPPTLASSTPKRPSATASSSRVLATVAFKDAGTPSPTAMPASPWGFSSTSPGDAGGAASSWPPPSSAGVSSKSGAAAASGDDDPAGCCCCCSGSSGGGGAPPASSPNPAGCSGAAHVVDAVGAPSNATHAPSSQPHGGRGSAPPTASSPPPPSKWIWRRLRRPPPCGPPPRFSGGTNVTHRSHSSKVSQPPRSQCGPK